MPWNKEKLEVALKRVAPLVERRFLSKTEDVDRGRIMVGGDRYILIRAPSMSVHFLEFIREMYPGLDRVEAFEAAGSILYDIAHALGRADAKYLHEVVQVDDPLEKLATGPIHFALSGWGRVEIRPESRPFSKEEFLLVYDHYDSFEAESWLGQEQRFNRPTCFMNAGYSAGWCSESFGASLASREIQCRACGDPECRFVMAPAEKLQEAVDGLAVTGSGCRED